MFLTDAPAGRTGGAARPSPEDRLFWAAEPERLMSALDSSSAGLTSENAAARLARTGPNSWYAYGTRPWHSVLRAQIESPLLLLLVFAAAASTLSGELVDAAIVIVIVVATVGFGFWREYRAETATAALQAQIRARATALRDGTPVTLAIDDVVPGDVVLLAAGSLVPGDGVLLESSDFYVNESALTGESFPVQKQPGVAPADAQISQRSNAVFLGTNVRSGTARCLIVHTGLATEFGHVAARLAAKSPITDFERGIRRFGYMLTIAMLCLVIVLFAAHVLRGRSPASTLLFSIALAVGLSPELLPAVLTINLSRGAQLLARGGVLVRRLSAIENLGSMDILCTDKTGTLTEGIVVVDGAYGPSGEASDEVLELAALNAALQTGLSNALDDAILASRTPDAGAMRKIAEIPFDFVRKRVSVAIAAGNAATLIVKGAFPAVVAACTTLPDGRGLSDTVRAQLTDRYDAWCNRGIRVLAVARRVLPASARYTRDDERDLVFLGFLTFVDRPKPHVSTVLADLARRGVAIKIISGDSGAVVRYIAELVGLAHERIITGRELHTLSDDALWRSASAADLFVEVDPDQKERIIRALRRNGHVVGFLGDGVNDAPAMHAADTSLSVDTAVDVARQAADFVLLRHDLDVIRRGIDEGRRTFANTMKYILTTTSANLGNMLSMACASLVLPFLPLLPGQILLNNFLSDIPAVGIADDSVDSEMVERPGRWDVRFIARFMLAFGVVSSLFDVLTFTVLLGGFAVSIGAFRTGWFIESLLTELVVALVVRTRRPFFRSRPGGVLLWSTVSLVAVTFVVPFAPGAGLLGFTPLRPGILLVLSGITAAYVAATELTKRWFYSGSRV